MSPLQRAEEKAKIAQHGMCKVYFKYYLCMCRMVHATKASRETEKRETREGYSERCANTQRFKG